MIFDKYDELKARGKPEGKSRQLAVGSRQEEGRRPKSAAGSRQKAKEITSPSVFQLFTPSVFWLAKPRLRLTGRDGPVRLSHTDKVVRNCPSGGPPGSMKLITGVPAWLINHPDSYREKIGILGCQNGRAREHPLKCGNAGMRECGITNNNLTVSQFYHSSMQNPIAIGSMNEKNFVMLCEFFVNSVLYPAIGGEHKEHEEGTENHRELHLNKGRPLALHGKTNAAGGLTDVEEASPLPLHERGERKKFGLSVFEYVNEKKKCMNCKRILYGKSPFRDGVEKECMNKRMNV